LQHDAADDFTALGDDAVPVAPQAEDVAAERQLEPVYAGRAEQSALSLDTDHLREFPLQPLGDSFEQRRGGARICAERGGEPSRVDLPRVGRSAIRTINGASVRTGGEMGP